MMGKIGAGMIASILIFLVFPPSVWPSAQGGPIIRRRPPPLASFEAAIYHAELALAADSVAVAKHHLQHVINCLEGKGGSDYKNDLLHPISCTTDLTFKDNPGIISGLTDPLINAIDPGAALKNAQAALSAALAGLRSPNPNVVRTQAESVLRYLRAARAAIG